MNTVPGTVIFLDLIKPISFLEIIFVPSDIEAIYIGFYISKIEAGEFQQVKKMVVLK